MTPADRESLRRIAYGPDATAEERAEAASALRQLDEAKREEAESEADPRAAAAESRPILSEELSQVKASAERASDDGVEEDEESPSFWRRSIRVAWLVPIVVGSIAVGYAASIGPLNAMRNPQNSALSASPTPPSAEPTDVPDANVKSGDLAAADSWFDRPYRASDTFPNAAALHQFGINAEDVRIAVNGGEKGSVWVGRTEGELCLVLADPTDGTSASSCNKRDKFAEFGIAFGSTNLGASWYGREVTTTPRLVPVATGPLPPTSGPGDLVAAVSWFLSPALPSGDLPAPDVLAAAQINPGDVRRVIPESTPWIKLWVAKQSTDGFCILSVDDADSSSGWTCASIEEFLKSGLTLPTQSYSFFWDGTRVSVTGH